MLCSFVIRSVLPSGDEVLMLQLHFTRFSDCTVHATVYQSQQVNVCPQQACPISLQAQRGFVAAPKRDSVWGNAGDDVSAAAEFEEICL